MRCTYIWKNFPNDSYSHLSLPLPPKNLVKNNNIVAGGGLYNNLVRETPLLSPFSREEAEGFSKLCKTQLGNDES